MATRLVLYVFLCVFWLVTGCAPTTTATKPAPPPPSYVEAKNLYEGIEVLAEKLITSSKNRKVGKIAVADLIGPGDGITALGEYLSDKVSVALFSADAFPDFMERKRLKQVLLAHKEELSGYFDPSTVRKFGKMIGVDSMVIGAIEDLGNVIDVTAKIVESETGRVQGMADVRLIKDDTIRGLLGKPRAAILTITVEPAVNGTVMAGGKRAYLEHGMVTLTEIPYGDCQIVIQPEGYESIRRSITIRSRSQTLGIQLTSKRYEVSFQISPPDASLSVDGQLLSLNPQGFAKAVELQACEHGYVVRAKGYQDRLGSFNPAQEPLIILNLVTTDPFYATKNKFFQKVQQVEKRQDSPVRLWTNKTSYQVGDSIYFYFRAERDCYLNLVDIASNGEIRVIFPNRYHPESYVRGGVTYRIPGEDYGFTFEVEPPTGTERVYAIASPRPIKIFPQDFTQEAFSTLRRRKTPTSQVRAIGIRVDQARLNAAAECVIQIR